MANITITNNDVGQIELSDGRFRDDTIKFAAADTFVAGTILARKLVSDTLAVAYTRAGSSDYTATASTRNGKTLQVGAYTLTAGTLTAGVGAWTAVAPNGETGSYTVATAAADIVFATLGITVDVTAVANPFETGDVITITVSAESGLPLVAYVKSTGTNGAQTPVAVLTYAKTVTAGGSVAARVLVKGEVNATRLVIDADGDATNVDDYVLDLLKANGIVATSVNQMAALDRQD